MLSLCLGAANWVDIYKKGDILLKPDPSFGAKTDWYDIFYDNNKSLTVAPDGCVFVSDIRQNKIYKFDKNGNLIKSFGQEGCGPGDVLGPADLSVLDEQYLVVLDISVTNRRISIFNLDGKFIEIIRSNSLISSATALRDNKIAYVVQKSKGDGYEYFTVFISDFRTKDTVNIITFRQKEIKTRIGAGSYFGNVFISRIKGGDLLVGYSENPEVTIYSYTGEKKYSFKLNIKAIKITNEMKEEFVSIFKDHAKRKPFFRQFLKELDLDTMFPEYVPFYRRIIVDADDNILVVKHNGFDRISSMDFFVYSTTGQYLLDSRLKFGVFKPSIKLPILFQKNTLYCILEKEEDDDSLVRLVKVSVQE